MLSKRFMQPIQMKIEEDLVTQVHHFYLIFQLKKPDPFKTQLQDMNMLSNLERLVVFDKILDLKKLVELSLTESLY